MLYLELHLFSFILSWWHFRANHYHLSAKCEGNEAENQGGSGIGYWRVIIKMQSYTHVPFMEAELKMWLMEQDTLNPYRACVKIKVQGETWGHSGRKLIKRHTREVMVLFTYSMQIHYHTWTPITIFSSFFLMSRASYSFVGLNEVVCSKWQVKNPTSDAALTSLVAPIFSLWSI